MSLTVWDFGSSEPVGLCCPEGALAVGSIGLKEEGERWNISGTSLGQ